MALDAGLVGRSYPVLAFAVERDRVAAFAAAVGHPGEGVPPTFIAAPEFAAGLSSAVADPELGLDLGRLLHAEQEYEWGRPLAVGETITAQTSIEDVRTKGGIGFVTLRTDVRDEGGRRVAIGRSTLVVRERV